MRAPAAVFAAAGRQDATVRQLHRLILDRPKNAVGQPLRWRPVRAIVSGEQTQPPPLARIGSEFVVQLHRPGGRLEQHRIPCWHCSAIDAGVCAIGDTAWGLPLLRAALSEPDADIGRTFVLTAEPGSQQMTIARFQQGGGVSLRRGSRVGDELAEHDRRRRRRRRLCLCDNRTQACSKARNETA